MSTLRGRLRTDEVAGLWVFSSDPAVTEIAAATGFDFVAVDLEHTTLTLADVVSHIRAGRGAGIPVLVRVEDKSSPSLTRVLDAGADGVIVPHVLGASDVADLHERIRYGPEGKRPTCTGVRSARYGVGDFGELAARANQDVLIVALVEDVVGVKEIDAIVSTGVVDAVLPGPSDLAAALGHPGKFTHSTVLEAIEQVAMAVTASEGVALAAYLQEPSDAGDARAVGARMFFYSIDYKILSANLNRARQALRRVEE